MFDKIKNIKTNLKETSHEELHEHFKNLGVFLSTNQEDTRVLEEHLQLLSEVSFIKNLKFTSYFLEKAAESISEIDCIHRKGV